MIDIGVLGFYEWLIVYLFGKFFRVLCVYLKKKKFLVIFNYVVVFIIIYFLLEF